MGSRPLRMKVRWGCPPRVLSPPAHRTQSTISRRPHLPGGAVRLHRRGLCPAVLGGTAADRGEPAHPALAWCTIHRCPQGPGLSLPVSVGTLLLPPELLRPRLNRHLGRRAEPLAGEWRPRVPARPQVIQEVDEAALMRATRRCWNLLFLRRWREQRWEENLPFVCFCSAAGPRASGTHFLKERAIYFSSGFSG